MREVTNMYKSPAMGLCLLVVMSLPFAADAGKIYKWIDRQGNVHYSSTPGPNQTTADNFSETNTHRQTSAASSAGSQHMLLGVWQGSVNGKSYKLRLNRDMMVWSMSGQGEGFLRMVFQASWKATGGDMEIIYINHTRHSSLNGQKALIRIISKSAELMTVQMPDQYVYKLTKSISRRHLDKAGKRLLGHWIRQDGAEILFKSGRYFIKERYSNRISKVLSERGNWKLAGDKLSLTITGGEESVGKQGFTKTYHIMLNDGDKLILSDTASNRQMTLTRRLK